MVAQSEQAARDFWLIREGHAIDTMPLVINFDVSLPIGEIDDFVERCRAALQARWPGSLNLFYGHIGDSNLHISVMIEGRRAEVMHDVDAVVYEVVRAMKGSVSAEHGVGTLKRACLGHSRSAAELAVMRQVEAGPRPEGHPQSRQADLGQRREEAMQAHIVLAHPERQSFNGHLAAVARRSLEAQGWRFRSPISTPWTSIPASGQSTTRAA